MKPYILLFTLTTLSACSTYQETFDCEPGKGMGCLSIAQVNQITEPTENILPPSTPIIDTPTVPLKAGVATQDAAHSIHRVPEEWLRLWIAPFEDDEGNLHEASTIHTVIKPGYWGMHDLGASNAR